MPTVAAFVDSIREFAPEAKVLYAKEGERELGHPAHDAATS